MSRKFKLEPSVSDPINLGDLRWLVKQCDDQGFSDDCPVSVKGATEYNQFEREPAEIKVHGERQK